MNTLEIILPLRNPPTVLDQTVKSLVAQTDRNFAVLLSDNYSTQGMEWIDAAVSQFRAANIAIRRVRPPFELGRVEHWNWAHHEAGGDWLKPVFAGDWLETNYVAWLRAEAGENPAVRYIYCGYVLHRVDTAPEIVISSRAGSFKTSAEAEQLVLRYGMQFGPPSAAAYERTAFIAIGGYPTALPISADSLMFCSLVARFGMLGIAEALCHFNIHGARFSTSLPQKRKDTFRESLTYNLMLGYRAWAERVTFSRPAYLRLMAREIRSYLAGK